MWWSSTRWPTRDWPAGVRVEDISYNPIAVVQRLQDEPLRGRFELAIIVGALQRPGRSPGHVSVYRWDNVLPAPEEIHEAVTEAVTGIISLDNTLVVGAPFRRACRRRWWSSSSSRTRTNSATRSRLLVAAALGRHREARHRAGAGAGDGRVPFPQARSARDACPTRAWSFRQVIDDAARVQ